MLLAAVPKHSKRCVFGSAKQNDEKRCVFGTAAKNTSFLIVLFCFAALSSFRVGKYKFYRKGSVFQVVMEKTPIVQVRQNEPPRDKTNNVVLRPAKTQISLGIRPV